MGQRHPRFEAVIASAHGEPYTILDSVVDDSVQSALSENQQSRLDAATTETIRVFPDRMGLYSVRSPNGERGDRTTYSVDMKYTTAKTCTCGDYMYRCDPKSGQMCKHLWRTNLLIRLGVLPEPNADPYDWLLDELVRDHQLLTAMASAAKSKLQAVDQMAGLIDRVRDTHRIAVDYPRICTARANILRSAQRPESAV